MQAFAVFKCNSYRYISVHLKVDSVPPETLKMQKDGESLVIFFGENSFGWVRDEQAGLALFTHVIVQSTYRSMTASCSM